MYVFVCYSIITPEGGMIVCSQLNCNIVGYYIIIYGASRCGLGMLEGIRPAYAKPKKHRVSIYSFSATPFPWL